MNPATHYSSLLAIVAVMLTPAPVAAQDRPGDGSGEGAAAEPQVQSAPAIEEDGTITVRAQRLRGQLLVDEPPILELDEAEIAALGAGSIDDLLQAIEPATGSARGRGGGRPIFLVNGVRIGSFREFRSYPPEAIAKVEVFPEETAQRFGFSPDQRVVNFVLKDNFASREVELEYEQPGDGGYRATEQEFTLLTIRNGARINAQVEAGQRTFLTESERDLAPVTGFAPTVPGDPDPLEFRSLISRQERYQAEASWAKAFIDTGTSVSFNLTANQADTDSLAGLDDVLLTGPDGSTAFRTFGADDPLRRDSRTQSLASSGSLNRPLGLFNLAMTFDAGWTDARTRIDRQADTTALRAGALAGSLPIDGPLPELPDAGFDTARSTLWTAGTLATLRGSPLLLPAGEVTTTIDLGYEWDRIESSDTRTANDARLTRGDASAGLNVNVPLTSRREGFADALGSFSLNGQAGVNHLSDFGTLYDWTLGARWSPTDRLTLSLSRIRREAAPGLNALGDPQVSQLNVPVFDFAADRTVLATVVTGGNPGLIAETQSDWKVSANWRVPFLGRGRLQLDYTDNRSRDVTSSFPALTPAFEAAFPDRVVRDGGGTLVSLDRRPVTLFEVRTRSLQFNFNTGGSIGSRPQPAATPPTQGRPDRSARDEAAASASPPGRPDFGAIRERFCATPEGEQPDLTGLPEGMIARLRDADGNIPPERLARLRARFCGQDGAEGDGQRSERFAAMRKALCGENPTLDDLPPRMRARLVNENGEIDQERLAQVRERLCSPIEADSAASRGTAQGRAAGQAAGREASRAGGGGRGGGGPGGGFFGGGNDPRPRYFLSFSPTLLLQRDVTPAAGATTLDALDGFVLGSSGALPEWTARLEGGLFFGGYGMRLSGRYVGSAVLRGDDATGSDDLFFGDIATFDLRLFADIGQVTGRDTGFLDGLRVSLRADNVFDARRRVVDGTGAVPVQFEPRRLDPTGRYLGVELRKVF